MVLEQTVLQIELQKLRIPAFELTLQTARAKINQCP